MLRPTYNDLIDSMNKNREEGELEVQSRYSVVIASAKRARQIIDGDAPLVKAEEDRKPLSIAIEEISKNLVNVEKGLDYEEEPMNPTAEVEDYSRYALDEDLDDEEEESWTPRRRMMTTCRKTARKMIILTETILRIARNNEFISGKFGL